MEFESGVFPNSSHSCSHCLTILALAVNILFEKCRQYFGRTFNKPSFKYDTVEEIIHCNSLSAATVAWFDKASSRIATQALIQVLFYALDYSISTVKR